MTSASIVLFWSAIFPILKKKSRVSKRMQLLARTTRAASLAFLSPCFAGKSKPSITQELIFCLKHIIFNPLHRLKSGGCVFHILAIDLGNRGGFPAHQIHLLMVLLLRLLVVASEGRFLQRPTVGRIVAFCVLHLLFRSF